MVRSKAAPDVPGLTGEPDRSPKLWVIAWVLLAGAVSIVTLVLAHGMTPDLLVYREGGRALAQDREHLYQIGVGPHALPFTYPPFAALMFLPWAWLWPALAVLLMAFLSWAAFSYATFLWLKLLGCRELIIRDLRLTGWAVATLLMPLCLLFEPIRQTLGYGQVNMLLTAAVVIDVSLPRHSRWRGVLIGLATGFKLTPAVFMVWLALTRQWRAFATATAAFAATIGVGFAVAPQASAKFWTQVMFNSERVGGLAYSANQSLNGAAWRWFGPGGHRVFWLLAVVVVTLLWAAVIRRLSQVGDLAGINLADMVLATGLLGLLISPVSWSHHWVWLWFLVLTLVTHHSWQAWVLATAWVFAVGTRVIWWFPSLHEQEYAQPGWAKMVTNTYVLLAILTLAGWGWWNQKQPALEKRASAKRRRAPTVDVTPGL